VSFTFDANPGVTRTGTFTVAGQTLTVTQAGANYVAANPVTTLVSSGLDYLSGVAVDNAGNVYVADSYYYNSAIKKWTAATGTVTNLVSSGLNSPNGLAVDGAGNVYIADFYNNAIEEVSRALVDPPPKTEPVTAGSNALPVVLPVTENLADLFAPTSDQPWLTITGVTNGVVSYAFTANASVARTAHLILLGTPIVINQAGPITASLSTTNLTEAGEAGNDSVGLTVSSPVYLWTAVANARSLHLSPANQSGIGSTTVVFTFDGNPGPLRTGTLTIAGQTLTITQATGNVLGTSALLEGPAAGTDSVLLAAFGPVAAWTATANAAWLHLSPANQTAPAAPM